MTDYSQKISDSFNERLRLMRLRRKKENLRFRDEFKLVPRWLFVLVILLFLVAQVIALAVNLTAPSRGDQIFPPELQNDPATASVALAGIVTAVSLLMATLIFLVGYVNRDAKRRGMNSALWTLLVLILMPTSMILGFVLYFLTREPLPYQCPQCGNSVGARFNFCPNCKCDLHPSCPQCKHEVVETDKYCPYCGNDLGAAKAAGIPAQSQA
jgi:ABC-type Fe3+ transport system permease subunit